LLLAVGGQLALAQPLSDPGFGDPTTLGGTPAGGGAPPLNPLNPNQPGSYVPQAPAQPGMAVRPNGWPGGAATPVPGAPLPPGGPRMAAAVAGVSPAAKKSPADPPYDPAEILARVGSERIQACEVLPMVNRAINKAVAESPEFAKLSPEDRQHEIDKAQKAYVQQAIKEMINTKLLVAEVRGNADKKALEENEKNIRDYFNGKYMAHLLEEYEAPSVIELENKLRALGGSIDSQRALFIEQSLASGWLNQAVKKEDKEPAHDEMLAYYRAHITDWETPARARWEQLTARWANFKTREEAKAAIARWGNDVVVRRRPFAEVAKAHSQDFAADEGGVHDWASRGSLKSAALDEAIFSVPVGAMSRILEDEEGCHIIRVLAREDAKRAPFTEAQPEIRKQLHDGGVNKRKMDYIKKLRENVPVWTVFDEEQPAQPAGAEAPR
jgi:parvulin-like peptidyl-prolyl isomerase